MRPLLFLISLVFLGAPASSSSQTIVSAGEHLVSVHADNATIEQVLQDFGKVVEVEYAFIAPDVKDVRVSLRLESLHPVVAVRKVLEKANVRYGVSGGDGAPFRIVVGVTDLPRGGLVRSETEEALADPARARTRTAPSQPPRSRASATARPAPGAMATGGGVPGATGVPFGSEASPTSPRASSDPGQSSRETATDMATPAPVEGGVPPDDEPPYVGPPGVRGSSRTGGELTASQPAVLSRATGRANVASEDASLLPSGPPLHRVAATGGILFLGFALGLAIVREPGT